MKISVGQLARELTGAELDHRTTKWLRSLFQIDEMEGNEAVLVVCDVPEIFPDYGHLYRREKEYPSIWIMTCQHAVMLFHFARCTCGETQREPTT